MSAPETSPDQSNGKVSDLLPRVLSALVLIPLGLGSAMAGGPWLAGATGAAVVVMSYEYARMSEPKAVLTAFGFALAGALGGVMLASHDRPLMALGWVALAGAISACRRRTLPSVAETWGGVLYIAGPCVAFLWIRAYPQYGREVVIALFLTIWAADVAAYFAGRLIGGPRFLPKISPQKTVAGIAGGIVAGAGAGIGCAALFHGPSLPWALVGAALAAFGMAGDLFESAVKRHFGVKDASRLIPGHGGVLDRLDGMMAATLAAALALVAAPGLAPLLLGQTP